MRINCPRISRQYRRCLFIVLCFFTLSGCISIPPILDYASWAISGISYVATGKGPSDHAISNVMKKDCSLFRVLRLKPICIPVDENTNKSLLARLYRNDDEIPEPPDLMHEIQVAAR